MRFLRIRIENFGPLRGVDSGPEPLPGMTVVHGPNEAGKTSFFLALRALLHGIYPANRDWNPFAPWSGETLEIEGEIETRAGEELRVHRRLLATPWGRLHRNGETENLANRSIPDLGTLSRELYEHVFTITLPQLAALQEGDAWETVRDRLVAGMGSGELATPREVADALEREAAGLWRPDRRGQSRDREIARKLDALADRHSSARDRDRKLREVVKALEENRSERNGVEERLRELRAFRERAQQVLPLVPRLATARERRRDAGDPELLEALPAGLPHRLEELREAVDKGESGVKEAEADLADAHRSMPEADPFLEAVAEREEGLRKLISAHPVVVERTGKRERLTRTLAEVREDVVRAVLRLFQWEEDQATDGSVDSLLPLLQGLPTGEIRRRIRVRDEVTARRMSAEEALPPDPGPGPGEPRPSNSDPQQSRRADFGPDEAHPSDPDPDETRPAHPGPREGRSSHPDPDQARAEVGSGMPVVPGVGGALLFVLGLVLLLVGGVPESVAILLAGAGLVALLVAGLQRRDRIREQGAREAEHRRRREEYETRKARVDQLRAAEEEAAREVLTLLDPLPLGPDRRGAPDEALVAEVEALRESLEARARAREELEELHELDGKQEAEIEEFRQDLPAELGAHLELPREVAPALDHLDRLLGRARAHAERMREARMELDGAADHLERKKRALQEARDGLHAFEQRVRAAHRDDAGAASSAEASSAEASSPGGSSLEAASMKPAAPGAASPEVASPEVASPEAASPEANSPETAGRGVGVDEELEAVVAELERRREALADARRIEAEVEEGVGPLDGVQEAIREVRDDPRFGDHSLEHLDALHDEGVEEATGLREERVRLEGEERALLQEETVDQVESEREALREEQREVRRERDRLHLLSRVVRAAEQSYREAHQPTLIRHAEHHLGRITGGRYTGLLLGDRDDPNRLQLRAPHLPGPTTVEEPISTGTREQVYLALRLAILELLEGEGEPLPLILDEVLVNWDAERRARAFDLFQEVARRRQVFLFTCHEPFAREAEARGGRLLTLPAPERREGPG